MINDRYLATPLRWSLFDIATLVACGVYWAPARDAPTAVRFADRSYRP